MSNPLSAVGGAIKTAAVDVAKGVETGVEYAIVHPIEFIAKAEKVLSTAIKDSPAIKSAVLALIEQASGVIADVGVDVAAKGINLAADAKTLADAESFFSYFKGTFVPLMEQAYSEIKPIISYN